MSIQVYPKQIVYCPLDGKEQDGDGCVPCQYYQGFRINGGQFFIDCKFDELPMSRDSYQRFVSTSLPPRE